MREKGREYSNIEKEIERMRMREKKKDRGIERKREGEGKEIKRVRKSKE